MVGSNPISVKEKLLKLMDEKQKIENQISGFGEILAANDNVGMSGPLVDEEGFPRNDIDVYKVRQARQQIICLQNDHKALMKNIEQLMHQLHSVTSQEVQDHQLTQRAADMTIDDGSANNANQPDVDMESIKAIVKITRVDAGSPAEQAGLRSLDEIAEFGSVNASNFNKQLSTIASVVNHMRNQRVKLKVLRGHEVLDMILIPQKWSGNGFLGCNIVLVD